ncbi:hypothetical protein MRB53_016647 [Persea americana]|uniref:Uncharacterized protein n=1 Tax=Persea americana TaxID=3435 RepID=A0ACC2M2R9_PERAE|nr:hypothetical protein MRB53_016647 [Persea americana]
MEKGIDDVMVSLAARDDWSEASLVPQEMHVIGYDISSMDPPERPEGHDPVGSGIESFQLWRISGESCPEGMIPIRRTTEKRTYPDARHFATSAETPQFSNNNRTPACAHASNVEERNAQCRHISHSFMSKKSPYARPSHITAFVPDPDAEVVSLSPKSLLESDRYVCEISNQGFQRD